MENSSIIKYLGIIDEGLELPETSPDNFFEHTADKFSKDFL